MNEPSQQDQQSQQNQQTREANQQPIEPVDLAIAHLAAFIQKHEEKRARQSEEAEIPEDIPRFLTY